MTRQVVLLLAAILSGAAIASDVDRPGGTGGERGAYPGAAAIEPEFELEKISGQPFDRFFEERFLSHLPPMEPLSGTNPMEAYIAGETYPRALEAVALHVGLKEAGRLWRRLARTSLKDRLKSDPSYGPQDFRLDMNRVREGWRRRQACLEARITLGSELHLWRRSSRPPPNLIENRLFSVGQDLRLRIHLQEMVGIVIGEGPEDDYTFEHLDRRRSYSPTSSRPSRLPRVQIRGRTRVHLDTEAMKDPDPWARVIGRYGGEISVDFLRRGDQKKILTAVLEFNRADRDRTEFTFGLTRRF